MNANGQPAQNGFELDGRFYPWHISDIGKDLMLIDRFAGLPVHEFFEIVEDITEQARAPVLLAMIATSIRAGNPDWSVERIVRTVMNVQLSAVVFVGGEQEEPPPGPPLPEPDSTGESSSSESRSTSSAPSPATSAKSNATPA